jgi:linoleate 10R-lipoxygenase
MLQYIAEKILNINERGTYSTSLSVQKTTRDAQDDEIFERARLVNCGFFTQIVLRDYIGAILALVQDGLRWRLSPLEVRQSD